MKINSYEIIPNTPEERIRKLILDTEEPNLIIKLKNDLISYWDEWIKLLIKSLSKDFSDEENLNYLYKIIFVISQVYNENSRKFWNITEQPIRINEDYINNLCKGLDERFNNSFFFKTIEVFKNKLYLELWDKEFNWTEIRKVFSELKVPWNNLKIKITWKKWPNFWSILQVTDDYIWFNQWWNITWLSKYNSNTLFSEEEEQHNDKYRIYEDITRFEYTNKQNNSWKKINLADFWDKLLFSFTQYYNSDKKITKNRINKICSELFLDNKSSKPVKWTNKEKNHKKNTWLSIWTEIINFINDIEKKYWKEEDFFQSYKKEKKLYNNFVEKYERKLKKLTGNIKYNKIEDRRVELNLEKYEDIISKECMEVPIDEKYRLSTMMKWLHSPELINSINKELNIDLTKLNLQTQLHLLNFLWKNEKIDFENVKNILPSLEKKEKYTFLKTFLLSSIDLKLWKVIINIFKINEITTLNKSIILEKYNSIMMDINILINKTYINYILLLDNNDKKTILEKSDILKQFISYTWSFFKDIEESKNIENTLAKFDLFNNEIKWIFWIIWSLTLDEISNINLNNFWYIQAKKYSWRKLLEEKEKKSKIYEQVSSIIAENFEFDDIQVFNEHFLSSNNAELYTLNANWRILYIVWIRDLEHEWKTVKYIDRLASDHHIKWFSLRLTEKFLKDQLHLWEYSKEEMIALWEPHVLTSNLLLEKFDFCVNGTSWIPEEKWKYWNPGIYFLLTKIPWKEFIAKWLELSDINDTPWLSVYNIKLPEDLNETLKKADDLKEKWKVISRMIHLWKDEAWEKLYTLVNEKK